MAAEQVLPSPIGVLPPGVAVVVIDQDHLLAVVSRRVSQPILARWRDPVGRAGHEILGADRRAGHADGVLLRPRGLIGLDKPDHLVLPLDRPAMALVPDLPEYVIQVAQRVDDLADIGLLEPRDLGDLQLMDFMTGIIASGIAVDAIDVVGGMERVSVPGVAPQVLAPRLFRLNPWNNITPT